MKRKISYTIIVLVTVILSGCAKGGVISEINQKAQSSERFVSVARYEHSGSFYIGKIAIKEYGVYNWISIMYSKDAEISNLDETNVRSIGYSMYDTGNNVSKVIYYFPDGTKKIDYDGVLPDNFIKYDTAGWSDSSRGTGILEKNLKFKSQNKKRIKDHNWNVVSGKYNLSGDSVEEHYTRLQINQVQGFFEIWFNEEQLSVIEIYKNLEKQPQVFRRFWLDKDISIDLEKISFDYLVGMYEKYYADAEFEKVYTETMK